MPDPTPASSAADRPPLATLLEGIERARKHTVWTLVALAVGTSLCWNRAGAIYAFLARPLTDALVARGQDPRLVYTGLTDPFILYFSVSLFGGLVLALPVLLAQLFVVLAPRLRARRLLAAVAFVGSATGLFLAGLVFGYEVLLPFVVAYLLKVGSAFQHAVTVRDFLRFAVRLLLALGVAAELPLVAFAAARLGVVNARQMLRVLPYAVVAAFILGAWLTPPDVLSQVLVAVPLLALYLIGIGVAALAGRGR